MTAKERPVKPDNEQSACYKLDMKMTRESLYHMVSVERKLNPSIPLGVWFVFILLVFLCFSCFLGTAVMCAANVIMGDYYIRNRLIWCIVFLCLTFIFRSLGAICVRSGIFSSSQSNHIQLDTAWNHFLLKNGEPSTVTYEFHRNYFSTSGSRSVHEYSQISCICETNQCLVLYTMEHGGYLLDKAQMRGTCVSALRSFLAERTGKAVRWIQVNEYIPAKIN